MQVFARRLNDLSELQLILRRSFLTTAARSVRDDLWDEVRNDLVARSFHDCRSNFVGSMSGKGFSEFRKTGNLISKSTTKNHRSTKLTNWTKDVPFTGFLFFLLFAFVARVFDQWRDSAIGRLLELTTNLGPERPLLCTPYLRTSNANVICHWDHIFIDYLLHIGVFDFLSMRRKMQIFFSLVKSYHGFSTYTISTINRRSEHLHRSHTIHFPAD